MRIRHNITREGALPMSSLAILILTKNEEDNIVDVVKNAKKCTPEVLVIDSGSTDKTVELAQAHGAKVCFRAWTDDLRLSVILP